MYALTTILFLFSAASLLGQADSITTASSNAVEETKTVDLTNNGFSLKTGYEGYIASVDRKKPTKTDWPTPIDLFFKSDLSTKFSLLKIGLINAKSLLQPFALKIFAGAKIVSFVLIWGIVATHSLCKFTGLCSFSMNLPDINKQEIKDRIVNMAKPFMSDETLDYTLRFARSAIDSYNAVQDFV